MDDNILKTYPFPDNTDEYTAFELTESGVMITWTTYDEFGDVIEDFVFLEDEEVDKFIQFYLEKKGNAQ